MKRRIYMMGGTEVRHPVEVAIREGYELTGEVESDLPGINTQSYENEGDEIFITKITNKPHETVGLLFHGFSIVPILYLLREAANNPQEQVVDVEEFDPERGNRSRIRRLLGEHAITFINQAALFSPEP